MPGTTPGRSRSATASSDAACPWRAERVTFGGQGSTGSRRRPSAVSQAHSILIVEDEQSIASFVSLYLKNAGYGVRAVTTGAGALNAVATEMPALIILDLNLPDMDGDRDLPPDPQGLGRADPDAHRAGRGRRQDHRARGRRRRLPDEAVQPARARCAREERPASLDGRSSGRRRRRAPSRRAGRSTPAGARFSSATTRSSSHRRSSISSGSCSTTVGSSSPVTSCSSASGATRSPETRARWTCTSVRSVASSATRRRS